MKGHPFFRSDIEAISRQVYSNYIKCNLLNYSCGDYDSISTSILSQLKEYRKFYIHQYGVTHYIKPPVKPLIFKDEGLYRFYDLFQAMKKYLDGEAAKPVGTGKYKIGLPPHLSSYLEQVVSSQLCLNKWLTISRNVKMQSAAFKIQTKDIHHGMAEQFHLDNDCDVIKAIIYPFDRLNQDGAFTYREGFDLNEFDSMLLYSLLQRHHSNILNFDSGNQVGNYLNTLYSHSDSFSDSREQYLNLLTYSDEQVVVHAENTIIVFKGDTLFHRGGDVRSSPRYTIETLFRIF